MVSVSASLLWSRCRYRVRPMLSTSCPLASPSTTFRISWSWHCEEICRTSSMAPFSVEPWMVHRPRTYATAPFSRADTRSASMIAVA